MGDDGVEDYTEYPEFSDALRRLGWLSSYARQVILSRHMLRQLQDSEVVENLLWHDPDRTILDCFRVAISVLTGANVELGQFSAPYAPQDRPETHYLAFRRKQRVFSVSIASALPEIAFFQRDGGSFGFENSTVGTLGDELLINEIEMLSRGVSLTTKSVADDRATALREKSLWGKSDHSDWSPTGTLFDDWLPAKPKTKAFWERWLMGLLVGEPLDWNLQWEVAMIPDEDWDKGPEHIAEVIARIEARMRTAVAPPLRRGTEDNLFHIDREPVLDGEILEFVRQRIGSALDAAIQSSNGNGFDENCYEALVLRQALDATNTSAVAGLLYDASLSFQKSIGDSYPEDSSLVALRAAAYASVEEICEIDKKARERCYRLSQLALNLAAEDVSGEIEEFAAEIAKEGDEQVAAILIEDAKLLARMRNAPKYIRARFTNYSATIVDWIDKAKKGEGRVTWLVKQLSRILDWWQS